MASNDSDRSTATDNQGLKFSTELGHLPPTFLDAIIPGYSVLANFFLTSLGIDITFYVSLLALSFVALSGLRMLLDPAIERVISFTTSTVIIDEWDGIWEDCLRFCASHPALQNLRTVRGRSPGQRYYEDSDDEDYHPDGQVTAPAEFGDDAIFNFKNWAARARPIFEPHSSSGFFWHKGHWFRIVRENEKVSNEWSDTIQSREKLYISVVWRSTEPIKAMIEEARELSLARRQCLTTIRRPTPKAERGRGHVWQIVAKRPSRPISTVVLDQKQKIDILEDVNEFLQPRTARWYGFRGIPYRRGYLFHGPPGTGKSSLSFALGGVFGLDIYCLSLSEITLTEEDMILLFNSLPKRCVVLLEDIDCAGISRPKPAEKDKKNKKKKSKKSKKTKTTTSDLLAAATNSATATRPKRLTNAITISGLLNAIDGVASAEGRVLVMTTNYPSKLDAALVRPGRVDLQIEFKLCGRDQIRELFLRMYCCDDQSALKQPTKLAEVLPQLRGGHYGSGDSLSADVVGVAESGKTISQLADEFADSIPIDQFSPAEIQGFLLTRKRNPVRAVAEVIRWRNEEIEKKKKNASQKNDEKKFVDENGTAVDRGTNASTPRGSETDDGDGGDDNSDESSDDDSDSD